MTETPFTEELALAIQGDLMKIINNVADVKGTITDMKVEIEDIKKVMATKEDIRQIRAEMTDMQGTIVGMQGTMTDMQNTMATKTDLNKLYEKLVTEINHGDRAVKTDQRLVRLERQAAI